MASEEETEPTRSQTASEIVHPSLIGRLDSLSLCENMDVSAVEREELRRQARHSGFRLLNDADDRALETLLHLESSSSPPERTAEISLFSSVKDGTEFLKRFYEHYSRLGVRHFFLVDDGSAIPGKQILQRNNVYWFRPNFGRYATSRVIWLKCLMLRFLQKSTWILTVDVDEFLDTPPALNALGLVRDWLEERSQTSAQAILVDMFPFGNACTTLADFETGFDSCLNRSGYADADYSNAAAWAFGKLVELGWSFDVRHEVMGTIDCLRKVPFFRFNPDLILNQGFHDLQTLSMGSDHSIQTLDSCDLILPIRNFTLTKFLQERKRELLDETLNGYHVETQEHIRMMAKKDILGATTALNPETVVRYIPEEFFTRVARAQRLLHVGS